MSRWLFWVGKSGPLASAWAGASPAISGARELGLAVEHLVSLQEPVGREDILKVEDDRAGDACHQILVGAALEVGGDQVLRAGVADPPARQDGWEPDGAQRKADLTHFLCFPQRQQSWY
jgi:hypothetical protein